ncbi:MAG: hypothetical protein OHK0039_47750 [Bacteroidia bacterium]
MRLYRSLFPFLLAGSLLAGACQPGKPAEEDITAKLPEGIYAHLVTNKGEMLARLEYKKAPLTVASFVGLAEGTMPNIVRQPGEPYFDDMVFHRVVPNFVAQVGDPNTLAGGDPSQVGRGGPGYAFRNETHPELLHNVAGTLSMANSGRDTNGSQFFITHTATSNLDGQYSVFGYVNRGLRTLYKIGIGDTLQQVRILRIGAEAEAFDALATFEAKR